MKNTLRNLSLLLSLGVLAFFLWGYVGSSGIEATRWLMLFPALLPVEAVCLMAAGEDNRLTRLGSVLVIAGSVLVALLFGLVFFVCTRPGAQCGIAGLGMMIAAYVIGFLVAIAGAMLVAIGLVRVVLASRR